MPPDVVQMRCGHCGEGVAGRVLTSAGIRDSAGLRTVLWLQCPLCQDGSVLASSGVLYPSAPAGGAVPNLPADVDSAWREARTAHAVAAYTAAEIMCRKILMHIAVDVGASAPGKNFVQYVADLDAGGYIPRGLQPIIDQVRQRGNVANHELPASQEDESVMTIRITEHLLRGVYGLQGPASI